MELAKPSPRRTLYLGAIAVVSALTLAAAIMAGPAVVNCAQSADGPLACLGRTLATTDPAPAGEPASALDAASEAAAVAGAPNITLLRAAPDGWVVIAGTGPPDAWIETFANGNLLGTTRAEASGDWVVVPDMPLPAGGVEITVGEAGSAERGPQSFVVVIDPDRDAEPLVVATEPGEAGEVLQGLPPLLVTQPTPPGGGSDATPAALLR